MLPLVLWKEETIVAPTLNILSTCNVRVINLRTEESVDLVDREKSVQGDGVPSPSSCSMLKKLVRGSVTR